jgi:aryl carrier-like protein
LHELTKELDLDYFMMFSSVVAEIGNPGQGSYAAANSFLDALARHRRAMNLPGLSVNWGALAGTGVVARNERLQEHLARQGWHGIRVRDALEVLGHLLQGTRAGNGEAQVAVADVDWQAWQRAFPSIGNAPRLAELLSEIGVSGGGESSWREVLKAEGEDGRPAKAEALVREAVAKVLGFEAEKLDVHRRLDQMGVDSLMAVELQHVLQAHSGAEFSAMDLMRGPTVSSLGQLLLQRLFPTPEA